MAQSHTSATDITSSTTTPRAGAGQPNGHQGEGGIVDRVKETAAAQLTTQKDRGIDAIGSVTQAVRSSSQKLRDEHHETIASYVEKTADQIENWSRQLREKDVNELLDDVQRLARRQPAVFIGSAFAIGLVAARFLKSSSPPYGSTSGDQRYRMRQSGGSTAISTASDRGFTGNRDVPIASGTVAVPEVPAPSTGATDSVAGRTRKPPARTERS
jgi:hypothetical protein